MRDELKLPKDVIERLNEGECDRLIFLAERMEHSATLKNMTMGSLCGMPMVWLGMWLCHPIFGIMCIAPMMLYHDWSKTKYAERDYVLYARKMYQKYQY